MFHKFLPQNFNHNNIIINKNQIQLILPIIYTIRLVPKNKMTIH